MRVNNIGDTFTRTFTKKIQILKNFEQLKDKLSMKILNIIHFQILSYLIQFPKD